MTSKNRFKIQLVFFILASLAFASPKIKFQTEEYDFGRVAPGDKVIYDFEFKNTGTDTLIIENVRSSCGCTATMLKNKELAPNEKEKIHIVFNTSGYAGQTSKTINVRTNDPQRRYVRLKIKGIVHVDLTISQKKIYIHLQDSDTLVKKQIKIENRSQKRIKITSIQTTSPSITTNVSKSVLPISIPADKRFVIYLNIQPLSFESGWKNLGEVIIKTSSKLNPQFTIPIYVAQERVE